MKSTKLVGTVVVLLCLRPVSAQTSNVYRGFHIGMTLAEAVAVGGGDLNKAQSVCQNPPKLLSRKDRELLATRCAKIDRTLSGQPTEWEFPKDQIRLSFENTHLIRITDYNGVIQLQEAKAPQAPQASEDHAAVSSGSAQPNPVPQVPSAQDENLSVAEAARRAKAATQEKNQSAGDQTRAQVAPKDQVVPKDTISLKGHKLGEYGSTDCEAQRNKHLESNKQSDSLRTPHIYSDEEIQKDFADCTVGTFPVFSDYSKPSDDRVSLYYNRYHLESMRFEFMTGILGNMGRGDELLNDAVAKFGKPTRKYQVDLQNGYGARWADSYYEWDVPGGHVEMYIAGRATEGEMWGSIKAETKELHDKNLAANGKRKNTLD